MVFSRCLCSYSTSSIKKISKLKKKNFWHFSPPSPPPQPPPYLGPGAENQKSQKTTRKYDSKEYPCKISSHLVEPLLLGFLSVWKKWSNYVPRMLVQCGFFPLFILRLYGEKALSVFNAQAPRHHASAADGWVVIVGPHPLIALGANWGGNAVLAASLRLPRRLPFEA